MAAEKADNTCMPVAEKMERGIHPIRVMDGLVVISDACRVSRVSFSQAAKRGRAGGSVELPLVLNTVSRMISSKEARF